MPRIIIALIILTAVPIIASGQKGGPKSMKVSDHDRIRQKYNKKFAEDALKSPKVVELTKDIDGLKNPLKLKDTVEFKVPKRGGGFTTLKGRFYSIDNRRARIGDRDYPKRIFNPVDWTRMQSAKNPELAKKQLAQKQADKQAEIKRYIEVKTDSALINEGYNVNFKKSVVVIGADIPHYVWRKDAGDGTFWAGVFDFDASGKHMEKFVKIVVTYKGSLDIAFVMFVEPPDRKGKPVVPCRFGKLDVKKVITEAPLKSHTFFFTKAQLVKELGKDWQQDLMKHSKIMVMKRQGLWDGIWVLKPTQVSPKRAALPLDCPDCWGAKTVSTATAVDIRKEVESIMAETNAGAETRKHGEAIIRKYATEDNDGDKKIRCPTCEGKGTKGIARASGAIIPYGVDKDAIFAYKKKRPEFKLLYDSAMSHAEVKKLRKAISLEYAKGRIQERQQEGIAEAKELVSEYLTKLNKSKYYALKDRFEWMTPKQLDAAREDNSPGTAPVLFGGNEKSGYAPKMLLGKKVRRFGPWLQLKRFKKVGSLEAGYDITQVYYRIVEIGGKEIEEGPAGAPKKKPGNIDRGRPPEPFGDEFEDPRFKRGTPPPPDMGGGPEGDGEVPAEPVSEIPEDIGDREYVFQYTINVSTRRRISVITDIQLKLSPRLEIFAPVVEGKEKEKLMGFPLKDADKILKLSHKFQVGANWKGWVLGSKEMSFSQMISDYGYRDLKVDLTVK